MVRATGPHSVSVFAMAGSDDLVPEVTVVASTELRIGERRQLGTFSDRYSGTPSPYHAVGISPIRQGPDSLNLVLGRPCLRWVVKLCRARGLMRDHLLRMLELRKSWQPGAGISIRSFANTKVPGSAGKSSKPNCSKTRPARFGRRGSIEASRLRLAPEMTRVVVAIDPAVTSGEEADETGIVVAGKDKNGHGCVLADISGRYPPTEWARLAIAAYARHRADRIVAEVNNGGDMVEATLRMVDPTCRLPRSAPRAARWCGPNRWRRSTSRAASITSAPSRNSKTR